MMATQKELIFNYLSEFGSITPMQAFTDLGITKLATRISEMKRDGLRLRTEAVRSKNRYGKDTMYARYTMEDNDA